MIEIASGLMALLPTLGISFLVKESIRKHHPRYGEQGIEVAHIQDEFLGGSSERSNLQPLTLPEHIVDHVTKAKEASGWIVARKQYGAAYLIAQRATVEEIEEVNRMLRSKRRG